MTVQAAVCAALAEPVARAKPSIDRLRALLELDRRAALLSDALLGDLAGGLLHSPLTGPQTWQAAFELSRSLGQAHAQFLRSMRDSRGFRGWREHLPYVVLRVFQHRQTELLLRPFVDERSTRFGWKDLHEAYRFAQSCGLWRDVLPVNRRDSPSAADTTLEREYIHVLLLDLMNEGHFPPHDAFWVAQSLPRWSEAAALEPEQARSAQYRLVVDPDEDAGLSRLNGESAGTGLHLDTASILVSIRTEIASLRGDPGSSNPGPSLRRGRQLKLLRKLEALFAVERPVIARRGEREPTALTVEVAVGMSQIVRALQDKPEEAASATAKSPTVTIAGGVANAPPDASSMAGTTVTQWSTSPVSATNSVLTMVDRSDSGCRLRGSTYAANPIVPGALIALREEAASQWTLAVVRRVKRRLGGKRVEIGAEYLGHDARRVVVVVPDSDATPVRSPESAPPRFAAVFLPESTRRPALPIKTLILPARGLSPENVLSVRSRTDVYTIQLKEPLEEQVDFVWSPFEILDRWTKDVPPAAKATSPGE